MDVDIAQGRKLIALKRKIEQNFSAENWHEIGLLTGCHDVIDMHPRLLRSLNFGDDDYGACVVEVLNKIIKRDPEHNFTIVEDYANTVAFGDAYVLTAIDQGRPQMVISPMVFDPPSGGIENDLVSAMMPFSHEFGAVYEAIKSACTVAGMRCLRADDIWEHSTVVQDIFSLICRSRIVICDFSGKNPNVFYEAGIAHTLGKHVIPIAQHGSDIPFDLRSHRFKIYHSNSEGLHELRSALAERIRTLSASSM